MYYILASQGAKKPLNARKSLSHFTFSFPLMILYVSIRSPRCLLSSREVSFNLLSLSIYDKCLNSGTNLVARL